MAEPQVHPEAAVVGLSLASCPGDALGPTLAIPTVPPHQDAWLSAPPAEWAIAPACQRLIHPHGRSEKRAWRLRFLLWPRLQSHRRLPEGRGRGSLGSFRSSCWEQEGEAEGAVSGSSGVSRPSLLTVEGGELCDTGWEATAPGQGIRTRRPGRHAARRPDCPLRVTCRPLGMSPFLLQEGGVASRPPMGRLAVWFLWLHRRCNFYDAEARLECGRQDHARLRKIGGCTSSASWK